MVKVVKYIFSCDELYDIYMALSTVIEFFGKKDLVILRDKLIKIISKECKEYMGEK